MASDSQKPKEVRCARCAHPWTVSPSELRELALGGLGPNAIEVVVVACPNCAHPRKIPVGPPEKSTE